MENHPNVPITTNQYKTSILTMSKHYKITTRAVFFLVVLGLYTGNTCLREPYAMRFYLGICLRLGYVLGHCLRDASAKFFSFDALQLFCFTVKQISDAWVLVSFSFREGSETESLKM